MIKKQSTVTLNDAFSLFLTYKQASNTNSKTVHNYSQSFNYMLRDIGFTGDESVQSITEEVVLNWIITMQERQLTISSINHYLTDMRVFIYWLMEREYIHRFRINLLKGQQPVVKYYTDDEIALLVKKPQNDENFPQYRTWVTVCFVLATGARASTLINIRINDIDFNNREITYRHLKNRDTAIIPLSSSLAKVLREYLSTWKREKADGWLFCDSQERQCTVSALHQALDTYCTSRGIKSKGMHALRHSFARGYIMNGGNALKLQKLLTHSTLEMTKRYVKLFSNDLKIDYDNLSPLDSCYSTGKISRKK